MAHPVAIPKLGLTMTDCTLTEWLKADGDLVARGDILFAIETDKITSEIESDGAGFLRRYAVVDTVHQVGAVIGALFDSKEAAIAAPSATIHAVQADIAPIAAQVAAPVFVQGPRIRVSPLARRIAQTAGIDPTGLTGTGAHGAILRRDVEAALRPAAPVDGPQRRPLSALRKTIARNMMTSLTTTAQMTAFGKVDMTEVVALRASCVANEKDLGVRVSFTDIILKACALVLARMPDINSSIVGDEVVTWSQVNIGLAVALDDGLIVPVIHDADQKSLVEIAQERLDLAHRARAGQLDRQDLQGGTFTLSNFGSYGGDFETPLLNPPQSAILGIGAITDDVVVYHGQIAIRPTMMLSMTFDHRLIDGAVAGRFRNELRALLENPATMLANLR